MTAYVLRFILYITIIIYVRVSRENESGIGKRFVDASVVAIISMIIQFGKDYAILLFLHPSEQKSYIGWAIVMEILDVLIPLLTVYIITKILCCKGKAKPVIIVVCTEIVCLFAALYVYEQVQIFFVSMERLNQGNFFDAFIAGQDLVKLGKVMPVVRLIPAAVLGFLKAKEEKI